MASSGQDNTESSTTHGSIKGRGLCEINSAKWNVCNNFLAEKCFQTEFEHRPFNELQKTRWDIIQARKIVLRHSRSFWWFWWKRPTRYLATERISTDEIRYFCKHSTLIKGSWCHDNALLYKSIIAVTHANIIAAIDANTMNRIDGIWNSQWSVIAEAEFLAKRRNYRTSDHTKQG